MGCACNKGKTSPTLADRKADAARKAEASGTSVARTVPGPQPTARTQPVMQGGKQSFSLQAGDKTASFGSRLERDAAHARVPGSRVV